MWPSDRGCAWQAMGLVLAPAEKGETFYSSIVWTASSVLDKTDTDCIVIWAESVSRLQAM